MLSGEVTIHVTRYRKTANPMKLHFFSRLIVLLLLAGIPTVALINSGKSADDEVPVVRPDQMSYNPFNKSKDVEESGFQAPPAVKQVPLSAMKTSPLTKPAVPSFDPQTRSVNVTQQSIPQTTPSLSKTTKPVNTGLPVPGRSHVAEGSFSPKSTVDGDFAPAPTLSRNTAQPPVSFVETNHTNAGSLSAPSLKQFPSLTSSNDRQASRLPSVGSTSPAVKPLATIKPSSPANSLPTGLANPGGPTLGPANPQSPLVQLPAVTTRSLPPQLSATPTPASGGGFKPGIVSASQMDPSRLAPATRVASYAASSQGGYGGYPNTSNASPISSGPIVPLPVDEVLSGSPQQMVYPGESVIEGEPIGDPWLYGADCGINCPPGGYAMFEALYFNLEGSNRAQSLNYRMPGYKYELGARVTVGRRFDCTDGWELSFAAVDKWDARQSLATNGGIQFSRFQPIGGYNALNLPGFYNGVFQEQIHETQMYSLEANKVTYGWDVMKTVIGWRYLQFNEEMTYNMGSINGAFGNWEYFTRNHMIGPQYGSELFYDLGYRMSVSAKYKGGAFLNFYNGGSGVNSNNASITESFKRDLNFAVMGELGANVYYHIGQRARLRVGYEAWGMYGLARVNKQLDGFLAPTTGSSLRHYGSLFLHGASVGFDFFW